MARITPRAGRHGPVTAARLRRTLLLWSAAAVTGLLLACFGTGFWPAFGLGLVLPGAGFLDYLAGGATQAAAHLLLAMGTVVAFGLAVFAWFATGNIVAPIAVWLGAAVAAGAMNHPHRWAGAPWLVAGVVALAAFGLRWRSARAHAAALARRDRRNAHLELADVASRRLQDPAAPAPRELDEETLGFLRFALDRALQPVDRFDGFDWIDQFQTAAVRYQLCGLGYALAAVQYNSLPAFRGYLTAAQRNLHAKMLDHRIWRYWAWENAWGNFRLDPDPVPVDDIMYTGWFGAMLGEYVSNTGDTRYGDRPLVLRTPSGRTFAYTFSDLAATLHGNFRRSPFGLYPCEPNWIYPMCNNFGIITLAIHDRLHGTRYWADIAGDYRRGFDAEFTTVDGRVVAIRSGRTGLTIPALTSIMADCVTAHFLHGVMPDVARRAWEIVRADLISVSGGDVRLETRGWDAIDTGNYRRSMVSTYSQVGAAAAEMGDTEVADLLRARIRRELEVRQDDGVRWMPGVSTQAHGTVLAHFAAVAGGRRRLHADGMPAGRLSGPLLVDAPYPDALVARADNAGGELALVLRPGRAAAAGRVVELGVAQLLPGRAYRCTGTLEDVVRADDGGDARVRVLLDGRREVRLSPN